MKPQTRNRFSLKNGASPLQVFTCPLAVAEMQDVEGGKYCHLCKHTLRDFTRSTPDEISEAFANGAYCGIFRTADVNPVEPAPGVFYEMLHKPYRAVTSSLFVLSVMLAQQTVAQNTDAHFPASQEQSVFSTVMVRMNGNPLGKVTLRVKQGDSQTEWVTNQEGMAHVAATGENEPGSVQVEVMYKNMRVKKMKMDGFAPGVCQIIDMTSAELKNAAEIKRSMKRRAKWRKKHPNTRMLPGCPRF